MACMPSRSSGGWNVVQPARAVHFEIQADTSRARRLMVGSDGRHDNNILGRRTCPHVPRLRHRHFVLCRRHRYHGRGRAILFHELFLWSDLRLACHCTHRHMQEYSSGREQVDGKMCRHAPGPCSPAGETRRLCPQRPRARKVIRVEQAPG